MNVRCRRTLPLLLVVVWAPFSSVAIAQPAGRGQVIAPGNPPLTQQMVDRVTTLLGDTVGQPLNAQQRGRMRTIYVGYWRDRSQDEMRGMLDLLDVTAALEALPPAQGLRPLIMLLSQKGGTFPPLVWVPLWNRHDGASLQWYVEN